MILDYARLIAEAANALVFSMRVFGFESRSVRELLERFLTSSTTYRRTCCMIRSTIFFGYLIIPKFTVFQTITNTQLLLSPFSSCRTIKRTTYAPSARRNRRPSCYQMDPNRNVPPHRFGAATRTTNEPSAGTPITAKLVSIISLQRSRTSVR